MVAEEALIEIKKDLVEIEKFVASEEWARLSSLLPNEPLPANIIELLPASFVRLWMTVFITEYRTAVERHLGQKSDVLNEAKKLMETTLGSIVGRSDFQKVMNTQVQELRAVAMAEDSSVLTNRITGIRAGHFWVGDSEYLVPFVRLRFVDSNDETILSSTLNTSDVSFLVDALSGVLLEMKRRRNDMTSVVKVRVPDTELVERHIRSARHLLGEN